METKLFEAACSGNLQALYDAVRENGGVCARIHEAMLKFCPPTLPTQSRWLYPLHLASAGGHLEIVTFLLEFGKQKSAVEELCMKKDRDGRTAIHSAVVNGTIDVIDVLFVHCPQAATEVTFHQDIVLHLVVKHHQHEALKFLIDRKFGSSAGSLLNLGDWEGGNTILHLATANRQLQVSPLDMVTSTPS
ncbi:hypothetical protein Salat_0682700 [Sesamum alatum]|uniref:Uncharacterized protein n=1 Tax=Sesamum alatum TaxID=300844 RepID=A0AAE1YRJ4_9LAMI|nr:hypothetical protein Salat_0682700 [Sesamum alatum]